MDLIVTAAIVAAAGLIIILLTAILLRKRIEYIDIMDTLLGRNELQRHATEIARSHITGRRKDSYRWLLPRMNDNFKSISGVYDALNRDIDNMFPTAPAAEWLLDNFYVLQEQAEDIRRNLSKGFPSGLPVLKNGVYKGYPRVYAIALELVSHTDGALDEKILTDFVKSYQSESLLSMSELWALPIMLKVALMEDIRQICDKIEESQKDWHQADEAAEFIANNLNMGEERLVQIMEERLRNSLSPAFVEHFLHKLRRKGVNISKVIAHLDRVLAEENRSTEKVTETDHQLQASRQVSIGNAFTSLRFISAANWSELFEELSHVEQLLREDPAGVYPEMDFESRDYYRNTIQKLAGTYKTTEIQVARKAVECAQQEEGLKDPESPMKHVGYYLVGRGRGQMEEKAGFRHQHVPLYKKYPITLYVGSILLATLLITAAFISYGGRAEAHASVVRLLLVAVAVLLPASDIAVSLINSILSHCLKPTLLPKMELREGIPEEAATMVIVPTLLPNEKRARDLMAQIESVYLANKDRNIYFALVGDFKDADKKILPEDEKISKAVQEELERLSKAYAGEGVNRFFYFHRYRQFSERQGKWMGWERKRGAIAEFNQLLRGRKDTSYNIIRGDITKIPKIKYIITLDADTNLPMGAARKLVGTMMHPLNRAVVDQRKGIVTQGYGLLQPRVSISITSANSTPYTRIFAGQGGIDPYTTAVSDIYQDLFGEGIFTGKGIYDLEVFENVLGNAIPDNTVLSHDLLEGSYVRTGLVTDIEMVDGYPARYNSASMRLHRWVRGDWQLLPWLGASLRNRAGEKIRNPLPAVSRWKIFDNLRRSLMNPALLLLILLGVSVLPGSSLVWLGLALFTAGLPVILYVLNAVLSGNFRFYPEKRYSTVIGGFKGALYQAGLLIVFIPYQAYLMLNAILKTLGRVFFTRRNMLEWVTAADMEASLKNNSASFWRKMWVSPVLGIVIVVLAFFQAPASFPVVVLLGIAWVLAPSIAYGISKPYERKIEILPPADLQRLRLLARKTWAFYEDFAGEEDHYLPPDNFQEEPTKVVAHRTSPTNIGFLLLAYIAARDMGYIGTLEMLQRMDKTLSTIEKMEKWNGHLYNWYDTTNLAVLRPRYVSTVDSGNFIGYLMLLEQALKEYAKRPLLDISLVRGLKDVLLLAKEELEERGAGISTEDVEALLQKGKIEKQEWNSILDRLESDMERLAAAKEFSESFWGPRLAGMVKALKEETALAGQKGEKLREQMGDLARRVHEIAENMKFKPLFDERRELFSIGFNVEEGRLTRSYYDLLASEARQASYIAVARGEVSPRHWARLGRKLVMVNRYKGLVSWTGTMFEYLMPLLVMKNYSNTLFDETYAFVVRNQIQYGMNRSIPWGVSESGYSAFDISLNYQYRAFGIPELGLKRGLENDVVIAPYATVLALPVDPAAAVKNIRRLEDEGMEGVYGLYEAVDYTPARLKKDEKFSIVRSFMAHHQGMSFIALDNFFNNNIMQTRFHADPVIRSAELLLQEKIPARVTFTKEHKVPQLRRVDRDWESENVVRSYGLPKSPIPNAHILSNGSYSVIVTDGGLGYSKYHDMAISRWSSDLRERKHGIFVFIQNLNSNEIWSAALEPLGVQPDKYKAVFSPDKAEFLRSDGNIETKMKITVSPEDHGEIRTVSITNLSQSVREVEVTSYYEVVLTNPDADIAHPAFSNLFIRTEFIREFNSIIASRRPRMEGQKVIWTIHTMAVEGEVTAETQYETDRFRFVGRNRDITNPRALDVGQPLSNSEGAVLDPVMSLRRRMRIEPGRTAKVHYMVAVADSRSKALELAGKYSDTKASNRAFELAWTRSQVEARYIGLKAEDTENYLNMIPYILFANELRKGQKEAIAKNTKGQSGLWSYGVSGDLPILLVRIEDKDDIDAVAWMVKAHEFWRLKGLQVDLVILLEQESSYTQPLHDAIRDVVSSSHARELIDQRSGVFIRNAKHMPPEDVTLFFTVARMVIKAGEGPVMQQLSGTIKDIPLPETMEPAAGPDSGEISENTATTCQLDSTTGLKYYNGLGGFSDDGKEYVITLREGNTTPTPWINVVSNRSFGFHVSEVGAGYTWAENGRENKLTPWSNDPVTDPHGEVFYIRDEEKGNFWSLTPMPVREPGAYTVRHGHGYSRFEHCSSGLEQQLTLFTAVEDPVKLCVVKLTNTSTVKRSLSLTYYLRPVLGVHEQMTSPYIVTGRLEEANALLATNSYSTDFPGRAVFVATSEKNYSYTGDRLEFLGAGGSTKNPQALKRKGLSGRLGAGYDPCIAVQVPISLAGGEEKEIVFLLGQGSDRKQAADLVNKYRGTARAKEEFNRSVQYWKDMLETVQVSTPDTSMDLLVNGWLLYQVISCRLWARSAFYQSGGAYGFRDQLQDVMAAIYTWPQATRRQILIHAAHQFVEGDVQHWWHEEAGKGIRTKYSDDLLWMPYVTADYIENTGDWEVLDEVRGYLESPVLGEREDERYEVPVVSSQTSSVYEHCIRAIERGLRFGEHGIPLMGCGDWNDGMNTVGNKGRGESVWLGWFLYTVLQKFLPLCRQRQDEERVRRYEEMSRKIAEAIEKNAWDGSWYRRAYFDDGTPLGSSRNGECSIDSISQSWSVISGVGRPARAEEALNAVERYLVDGSEGIIKLLTPPFDNGDLHPGYIKGYVPGVRENGGQYTHAATWVILAFAKLGRGDRAWELFNMINPINHTRTPIEYNRYKVEPYVMAADVYAVSPHAGRGGWSWYTGAAGWMYRVGIEHILGVKKRGEYLVIDPCIPKGWCGYTVTYKHGGTTYGIDIQNPQGVSQGIKKVTVDGQEVPELKIPLEQDGRHHKVEVLMGS